MEFDLIGTLKLDAVLPEASSMRAKLQAASTTAARMQIERLAQEIARATESGQSAIRVDTLETGVKAALGRKGYKVTYYTPDQRDTGSAAYYTVSW
ncbi:hypothetical protein DEIPH_ctg011orf0040 [Deinococcus phoenicis]|uniref:Uncharacterized protein n=1 Tax=Deinococcus phoenicis TaxID=1476583 RepID=A0A016QSR5_9DEIO|nr:hypothetical protein [Deinococcus phoenicis]EYB69073.1 hypothetical protein DEIPH_ctg011orf0040 [Deinococcus phoenicis]